MGCLHLVTQESWKFEVMILLALLSRMRISLWTVEVVTVTFVEVVTVVMLAGAAVRRILEVVHYFDETNIELTSLAQVLAH